MGDYLLHCQFLCRQGGHIGKIFSVTVSPHDTVAVLTSLVQRELPPKLAKEVSATSLTLWQLDPPLKFPDEGPNPKVVLNESFERFHRDPEAVAKELFSVRKVSRYFEDTPAIECLHLIVEVPHVAEFDDFEQWKGTGTRNRPNRSPVLQVSPQLDGYTTYRSTGEVDNSIDHFLKRLRPRIESFLTRTPAYWAPQEDVDATTRKFYVDLAIPLIRRKPSLLIHGLGNTRNPYADNLSRGEKHKILCNTSGSGKTRLLFDLLCQHWGFYFVMLHGTDRIGATDFEMAIEKMAARSDWIPDIFANREPEVNKGIVSGLISKILFARWIIFREFINVSKELNNGTLDERAKLNWLLFQVHPIGYDQYWDPFIALIDRCLVGVSKHHLSSLMEGLEPGEILGSAFNAESDKFLYVLDEAQVADKQHTRAFADSEGKLERPVLSPIIYHLAQSSGSCGKFIVSGTGFSLEQFEIEMASGISKDKTIWETVHETGDFTDQVSQFAYISRYFPPSFFLSPSGQALKPRLYEWLRGRYRFTARYIEELLKGRWEENHPASPHRLLDAYINACTNFNPLDSNKALLDQEPPIGPIEIGRFEWKKIENEKGLLEELAHSIFTYLTEGKYPMWHYEWKTAVEYGIARFTMDKAVQVEEPLALIGIVRYFDSCGYTPDHPIRGRLQDNKGVAFEEIVLLAVSKLLRNGKALSDIFEFHPSKPEWACSTAEIVAQTSPGVFVPFNFPDEMSGVPPTGVMFHATNPEDVGKWLKGGNAGWYIPGNLMGPDLMTWIRLSDKKLLLLVIQAKCYFSGNVDTVKPALTATAIRSLIPDNFFAFTVPKNAKKAALRRKQGKINAMLAAINKPDELFTSGKYNVLRVVAAFPLGTNFDSKSAEVKLALEQDNHPLAFLTQSALTSGLASSHHGLSTIRMLANTLKRTREMADSDSETVQPNAKIRKASSK